MRSVFSWDARRLMPKHGSSPFASEQELRQVRTVLARDAGDECFFGLPHGDKSTPDLPGP